MLIRGDACFIPLADKSVHCAVFSPPYWRQRDYGVDGQIGLEGSYQAYVDILLASLFEVERVLRDDGSLWLVIGDKYGTHASGQKAAMNRGADRGWQKHGVVPGMRNQLLGLPWRVAFGAQGFAVVPFRSFSAWSNELDAALTAGDWSMVEALRLRLQALDLFAAFEAHGFILRSEIVWHKLNPMPESVTNRPTRAHEQVFLFSKLRKFYYDHVALLEPAAGEMVNGDRPFGIHRERLLGYDSKFSKLQKWRKKGGGGFSAKTAAAQPAHGAVRLARPPRLVLLPDRPAQPLPHDVVRSARDRFKRASSASLPEMVPGIPNSHRPPTGADGEDAWDTSVRNKRDVWTLPSQQYKGAHFATYPEALVEPCILGGTSARGACPKCGAPWLRQVKKVTNTVERNAAGKDGSDWQAAGQRSIVTPRGAPGGDFHDLGTVSLETTGWEPGCACDAGDPVPCIVLDPYSGTGTTGVVARRHRRAYVGMDLSAEYLQQQQERLAAVQIRLLDT